MKPASPLSQIVGFSLRFKGVVIALACAAVAYGIYTVTQARYDVFPEFAPPQVTVQTEVPGLSPEQVETLVTQPIENELNGVAGIESLRSSSIQGLSVITVSFDPRSDILAGRQSVSERITALAGQLPAGVKAPVMRPLTSSTSIVFAVGLTSEKKSLMDLRTVADWVVKQRLLAVRGVAKASVFGGEVKQLQVQVFPEKLIFYGLSLNDVLAAAEKATGVRGAGFVENDNQRVVLQTEGQRITPELLAKTVLVRKNGVNVTLGDIARVVEAPEPPFGAASIRGRPGVMLMVSSQFGANTLDVTRDIEDALAELKPSLAADGIELHTDLFRPANFIETAAHNITFSLILGAVLVVVVLFLFLFNLRTAAISCTAIPLSLLAAVVVLEKLGFTLNTMTLGGLAIAIGEVVDDAIIDVENILRRLRENRLLPSPLPAIRVILSASLEVRSAVVYATFAVVLVFLPVLTMTGLSGRLFAPLGIAYIGAIVASLVVALTVTPALCLAFLGHRESPAHDSPLVRWLKRHYERTLRRVDTCSTAVIIAVACATLTGLAVLPFLGGSFLPELREGHFIVHMTTVPGTSLAQSLRLGKQVTDELLKLPFVRQVGQRVGRAEAADDTLGTNDSEFDVDLKPLKGDAAEESQGEIRRALAKFPGASFAVNTFLTERVEETLSGFTAQVVVNVFGNDLDQIDAKASEIARVLSRIPGATDVQVQSPPGTPQLSIRLRPDALLRWGVNPINLLDDVRTAYQGATVGQIYEGNRTFGVSVILAPEARRDISQIRRVMLRSAEGVYLPLDQLARIDQESGRYVILHDGARRVQAVTCNVSGRAVSDFADEAAKRISEKVEMPPSTYFEMGGTAKAQAKSQRDLLVHSALAGLGIILLLSIVTEHWRNLLLIVANLPFALVGGVLAVFALGGSLSIGALVGFVTLFGITLRNSIMLISHYEHLVRIEGCAWNLDTVLRGASERLTPILMTATVTALGLLPLALGSGDPGREIEGPMAIVILGGLLSSTALNLLVLPTLAQRFGFFSSRGTGL